MRKCNNHDIFQILIENTYQIGKRCRYLHQTDFPSRIPRSQKTRNSKGFCEDNLPLQMAEQNSQGGAGPDILSIPTCAPPRQAYNSCLLTNSNGDRGFYACTGSQKAVISSNKKAPTFASVQKWGLLIHHRNHRQRSSCSARRNRGILPESY